MSNRFHSKYHRHNHHTRATRDPRYPDAAHDPIASPDFPFMGDFVLNGTLSATSGLAFSEIEVKPAGVFTGDDIALYAESTKINGIAIETKGDVNVVGTLSADDFIFKNGNTLVNPITATFDDRYLVININGVSYGLQLWNLGA